jgi:xanthine dehydrogenase accessory factor
MNQVFEDFLSQSNPLVLSRTPFVVVTLVQLEGHVPQNTGAKAIVTAAGLHWGTVGGGRLEAKAIQTALEILNNRQVYCDYVRYDLRKDLEMVCGGVATLFYEHCNFSKWNIAVFGAGHVAQATIDVLKTLSCKITCVDHRREWLEKLPKDTNVIPVLSENPSETVPHFAKDSYFIVMTQGHATDLPIVTAILKNFKKPSYLGVIGSVLKARTLKANLLNEGFSSEQIEQIFCPIGIQFGTNSPQEIAISIAAQLLTHRDQVIRT